ncbi:MAG: NAD(P)/FAD-dependent oxidoreductase [Acetobacteraceae bacterium]
MTMPYDLIVVGGGVMGSAAALQAARGGMRVALLEQATLASGASGVNAGTLSLSIKRVALMPFALKGYAWWQEAGEAVGYRRTGGATLAFSPAEADLLEQRAKLKAAAGAPIEMISPKALAEREPALSREVVAATWCDADGYSNSSLTGTYFRALLRAGGVETREQTRVQAIARTSGGFTVETAAGHFSATRLLLASGAWLEPVAAMLGVALKPRVRVNTVSVTERSGRLLRGVIGHATGLLTLKQKENGTVLIGGGWQGRGAPSDGRGEVVAEALLGNLRLAEFAVPALRTLRLVRAWTGFEANMPDFYPLAGALPGVPNAFVLGCVRGGYTIGPYIGRLLGDLILGRDPELPLFDPGRFATRAASLQET